MDALTSLIGNQSLLKIFKTEQIIHDIVATIDNLPGPRAPMSVMPVEPARGKFIIEKTKGTIGIDQQNAIRYTPYVRLAESLDAKKLVELYVRLYPLFQQSYEELGYPGKYFNDRLMVAIDDLLAAPEFSKQIKLEQPKYYYQYADPDIESLSIGQRILVRIGIDNEMLIKNKIREIKQELIHHMHKIGTSDVR
ncbi:ATP-dependent DNA helicase RecG [Novimethylophilus kurashikiensis]|uniref:ATP-dependent DNA helicase RecG n=2 Tax=Novimethylophilus kurashikiensis TaxID=1825523 RepID=A0A2R5F8S5_9PROT|nr:ATP-dependent DNA helicase RecG [Novimethylophilus kurashikiensis]